MFSPQRQFLTLLNESRLTVKIEKLVNLRGLCATIIKTIKLLLVWMLNGVQSIS